ncbi:hypothetical protein HK102_005381 [Quaeritorhiza haematococci]|nr:hypothetical protein HK102_005381 [Quaeritorhiza haematococci]
MSSSMDDMKLMLQELQRLRSDWQQVQTNLANRPTIAQTLSSMSASSANTTRTVPSSSAPQPMPTPPQTPPFTAPSTPSRGGGFTIRETGTDIPSAAPAQPQQPQQWSNFNNNTNPGPAAPQQPQHWNVNPSTSGTVNSSTVSSTSSSSTAPPPYSSPLLRPSVPPSFQSQPSAAPPVPSKPSYNFSSTPSSSSSSSSPAPARGSARFIKQLKKEAESVKEDLKKRTQTAIDVAFLLDLTGSMDQWLAAAKNKIVEVIDKIKEPDMYPDAIVRVAFVGYRDFEEKNGKEVSEYDKFDFTDAETIRRHIANLKATGGDDAAEDVLGGLAQLLDLKWRSRTKLVIHICDAAGHGRALHDYSASGDRWLNGPDPAGRSPETSLKTLLRTLVNNGIDYHFFHMTEHTKKMEKVFEEHMETFKSTFHVHDAKEGAETFLPKVLHAVTTSVMRSMGFA